MNQYVLLAVLIAQKIIYIYIYKYCNLCIILTTIKLKKCFRVNGMANFVKITFLPGNIG